MGVMYNKFETLPYMPYKLISSLFGNEIIWKLLKYDDYDCLAKDNLTEDEKIDMVWRNQENQADYNVFLTPLEVDVVDDSRMILKAYHYNMTPENNLMATACFKLDFICLGKSVMVDYNGYPCSKLDVMKTQLLKTLNGQTVGGIGKLVFDTRMSRWCGSATGLGNNKNATGDYIIMATKISSIGDVSNG